VYKQLEIYIREKRAQCTNKLSKASDILELALLDPEYGSTASTSELVDQLKTFFFAGHDTTAAAITWAYYYLTTNPSTLATLRAELDDVLGHGTTPYDIASQFRKNRKVHLKLDYTLAVIKEALRLEPPASTARTVPADYSLTTSSGTVYHPREGSVIYVSSWLLHRNKSVWGDDALEFRPERFLPGAPVPRGYVPFGKRPRDCIGSNLAYLEVRPSPEGLLSGWQGLTLCRPKLFWR
jgi:cytochrome P450